MLWSQHLKIKSKTIEVEFTYVDPVASSGVDLGWKWTIGKQLLWIKKFTATHTLNKSSDS